MAPETKEVEVSGLSFQNGCRARGLQSWESQSSLFGGGFILFYTVHVSHWGLNEFIPPARVAEHVGHFRNPVLDNKSSTTKGLKMEMEN